MVRTTLVLVLLATVSVATPSSDNEQTGPQIQCLEPRTSSIKVVLRTQLNRTGHWVSRVGVKHRIDSAEGGEADLWLVDVEQNTETCDHSDSLLETVFYLSAPPLASGRPTKRTPGSSVRPTSPVDLVCPSCPPSCSCAPPPSCPPPPPPCPPQVKPIPDYFRSDPRGYEHYPSVGNYKVSLHAETWLEAKRTCEYDGAHLLILNSEQELNAIKSLLNHYPTATGSIDNGHIFLGAQRIGDTYFTVLGGELASTGYVRWNPGQPGGGSEMCLTMYRPPYLFHDITCSVRLGFVCEQFIKT